MRTTLRSLIQVGILLLIAQFALGQGSATGDLRVTVKDPKGNVVTNATVRVKDVAKGVERAGSGDGEGGYNVRQLAPGTYTVIVDAPGFTGVEATNVNITVGQLAELPVGLNVSTGKEVVEVTSEAELVETSRTSTTDTIGERKIEDLPINGRNYIQFTLTDSQVVRDNAPSLGGAAPTSGLNMSGQRGRSNLVNVDGADATDNSVNGVRSTLSQEAVQEFQIITNSYAAEYGRASGGVVNIITKSGTNDYHGDIFGYLRNRNFQAVNPFSTTSDPAYTRAQAGAAFGGPIKKDKTYFYFGYEITRRHETGFSSIGNDCQRSGGATCFGLTQFGALGPDAYLTPEQIGFITNPSVIGFEELFPAYAAEVQQYTVLAGASSGQAINGAWPVAFTGGNPGLGGFPTTCSTPGACFVPGSYQTLASQEGNFPVSEGTSLYSLRLDHNISNSNRLSLSVHASPSTVTGIEVSGQDQPFGQNAYSRTSQTTYRDVTGTASDTWTIGNNRVNEFLFQYARRGYKYFYNTEIPGGSDPAVNIPGYAYFGREPYSYIKRVEQRYQFKDNFAWSIGRHETKFGGDVNYLPLTATFTVNYGGVYDIANIPASEVAAFGFVNPDPADLPDFPGLSPVQAYGAGLPSDFIQGLGSPTDSFHNLAIGVFWQDSWRVRHNVTLNYGVRYDVEPAPKFAPPQGLALPAYHTLGLQKGIQTDKNNFQPRIGIAWDPKGDGKTVWRASFGMFYDHPLLGLYFLGDASDGSSSGQLAFAGTGLCNGAGDPSNLSAWPIFQGLIPSAGGSVGSPCSPTTNPAVLGLLNYNPDQQRFTCATGDPTCGVASPPSSSIFLTQNYLNPSTFLPLVFQPFGYPQAKNFVYAYSQQANLTYEHDLGGGYALSLAYNFNGGRHLNRPINANTIRGDLMMQNFIAASQDPAAQNPASPFTVGSGAGVPPCNVGPGGPWLNAAMMNFFRPGGLNPAIAGAVLAGGGSACIGLAQQLLASLPGFNTACDPSTFTGCVPFGDMDANYSNGSSVYHGLTANLRKRFSQHYEFLASYTWSHAIDDSTDLQSTTTPQDSYYPGRDRSTSLFDERHRFVFSGVYQSGRLSGSGFASKLFSDWTVAPLIEFGSGRPFNIITGNDDNFQLSSLTARPNAVASGTPPNACGNIAYTSKYSKAGAFQEPCPADFDGTLGSLDGNVGRNAGISPWNVFNDLRVSRRVTFSERYSMDFIADMFNIANVYNVAAVNPLCCSVVGSGTQSPAGQATAAYDPRQFQFALKLNW
jgi:hypothetical protein